MNKLSNKYQLWYSTDGGYSLEGFDDLNELPDLIADKYCGTDYYVTQRLKVEIREVVGGEEK